MKRHPRSWITLNAKRRIQCMRWGTLEHAVRHQGDFSVSTVCGHVLSIFGPYWLHQGPLRRVTCGVCRLGVLGQRTPPPPPYPHCIGAPTRADCAKIGYCPRRPACDD